MKKQLKYIWIFPLLFFLLGALPTIDPTRPPKVNTNAQATPSEPYELTAVFLYPQYSIAIINEQTYKVGDKIDEFTITTIHPNTVELTGPQGNKEILQLTEPVTWKH